LYIGREKALEYQPIEKEIIMERSFIKGIFFTTLLVLCAFTWLQAQESKPIKLPDPTKKGGLSIMETFAKRSSYRSWADKELSTQDLSNLLWAANGINRPDSKKRTAPSALNSQDVDIYVFIKSGVYLYDAASNALNLVAAGDHRSELVMSMGARPSGGAAGTPGSAPAGAAGGAPAGSSAAPGGAPPAPPGGGASGPGGDAPGKSTAAANLVMVSDISKFPMGTNETKKEMGVIDAAIVSENIGLFCAGSGLVTVPRIGSISNKDALKTLLKLKDTQYIVIENAVGYPAETK
jgi:nitroreductase